jgi:p-aminobenzoyl-glutamate transporter AbgT
MRIISYILVVVGILLLARAGYDEFRGSTRTPTSKYNPISETVTKNGNPDVFHNAMTYHWFYASMIVIAGVIAYVVDKGQDKVDPMSSDADEKIDEELRKDELDEETKTEKERHKHPEL